MTRADRCTFTRRMTFDEAQLAVTASEQHGVFDRCQALDSGASPRLITSRLDTGRWSLLAPGVYSFPGHADSWRRRLWIAVLSAGPTATVGFQAAGRLHEVRPLAPDPVTLIVDRPRRHATASATWHRLDDLAPSDLMVLDGLRVTTPARTFVDLAAVLRRGRYEQVLEDAIVRGLVTVAEVGAVLGRVRRRGKPGVALTEQTLDLLGPGEGLARSELEKLLDGAIDLARLPTPSSEHPLPSVQCLTGFVDRCYPEAKWIIEAGGRKWHERRRNMVRDADRDTEAARCGYLTTRRMWEHLSSDPDGEARALADIYAQRVELFRPR